MVVMISERWPRENCFTGTEKRDAKDCTLCGNFSGMEGQIFDDITEFKLNHAVPSLEFYNKLSVCFVNFR